MQAVSKVLPLTPRSRRTGASVALVGFASLFVAWLLTHGMAGPAVVLAMSVPVGLFLLARPEHGFLFGLALLLLVPYSLTLGVEQAGIPRVGALLALGGLALAATEARARTKLTTIDLAVAGFVLFGFVSWQLGAHPPQSLRATVNYLVPFAFYPVARRFARDKSETILWVLLVGGALASLSVYLEFLTKTPLTTDASQYDWNAGSKYLYRPGGVYLGPPTAATILAMTTLCGLPLLSGGTRRRRVFVATCCAVSVGAVVLTFTRGSLIGLGVGLVLYLFLLGPKHRGRLLYGAGVLALVLAVALPLVSGNEWYQKGVLRPGTFQSRQGYWAYVWPAVTSSPKNLVLGHGVNSLIVGRPELPGTKDPEIGLLPDQFPPHSQYLRTLLEEGVVGLALLCAWLFGAILVGVRSGWRAKEDRPLFAAGTAALVSVAIACVVGDAFRSPPILAVTAVIMGLIVGRSHLARDTQARDP